MVKLFYKVYLALHNNKFIDMHRLFVLSYNIHERKYFFWYLGSDGKLMYFDSCDKSDVARFKWKILMCGGVS